MISRNRRYGRRRKREDANGLQIPEPSDWHGPGLEAAIGCGMPSPRNAAVHKVPWVEDSDGRCPTGMEEDPDGVVCRNSRQNSSEIGLADAAGHEVVSDILVTLPRNFSICSRCGRAKSSILKSPASSWPPIAPCRKLGRKPGEIDPECPGHGRQRVFPDGGAGLRLRFPISSEKFEAIPAGRSGERVPPANPV